MDISSHNKAVDPLGRLAYGPTANRVGVRFQESLMDGRALQARAG
jgi:hypothetical protein